MERTLVRSVMIMRSLLDKRGKRMKTQQCLLKLISRHAMALSISLTMFLYANKIHCARNEQKKKKIIVNAYYYSGTTKRMTEIYLKETNERNERKEKNEKYTY
mmetsp:Transcript_63017/g.71348  ORF Transcript_63017/g.71348 Transcript_63017/m.71348 type:complete len:103 (-) Transcript_63017:122-430(-)